MDAGIKVAVKGISEVKIVVAVVTVCSQVGAFGGAVLAEVSPRVVDIHHAVGFALPVGSGRGRRRLQTCGGVQCGSASVLCGNVLRGSASAL